MTKIRKNSIYNRCDKIVMIHELYEVVEEKKKIEVIKPIIEGQETHSLINLMRTNKKVGHLLIIWIELRV